MHQHDIFESLEVFAVLQNREVRADGRAGRQHPQRFAIRHFIEHKEACGFTHNLYIVTGLQRGKARAELAVRHGDKIELQVRVIRCVDVRVSALYAFPPDIQTQLGKLPGRKRANGRMQGEAKQRVGPELYLCDFTCYPVRHDLLLY